MENEVQLKNIINQEIRDETVALAQIEWRILRLDLVHPVISGNKYFKLKYYLSAAIAGGYRGIITFGGAWSNHVVATAFAANANNLRSLAIIRGEKPSKLSHSLLNAESYGMEFRFVSRNEYALTEDEAWLKKLKEQYPDFYIIPAGGYGIPGAKGAAEILQFTAMGQYTHICCACGTGTMFAGLINASGNEQECIGISVLKGPGHLSHQTAKLLLPEALKKKFNILNEFHFGGYAKQSPELFQYMNNFYQKHRIATDFIYTAKLMYAIEHLIRDRFFPMGSRILAIHSGGLQGNHSLNPGILDF